MLLRAWFRYLRQTGLSYGLVTVVDALRKAPDVARGPDRPVRRAARSRPPMRARRAVIAPPSSAIDKGLAAVAAIDDDRILRLIRGVIAAELRTNAFAPSGEEALAFKLDSRARSRPAGAGAVARDLGLFSPRLEGIHLRGGPIARGGLRWSDRRDDFRTEVLGLMKAQVVKNAVIVPTGAKGGFYPKQLAARRRIATPGSPKGTESYRIFIRALLSVTDNLVKGKVVHPAEVVDPRRRRSLFRRRRRQGHGDLLRRRQCDRDRARLLARRRLRRRAAPTATTTRRWGSPPRAPGSRSSATSARWASTCRSSRSGSPASATCRATCSATACCCRKALKLVAAFDHRHIFLDPDPDPAKSWKERKRHVRPRRAPAGTIMIRQLISKGGGVFPRSQKVDPALASEVAAMLGLDVEEDRARRI